MAIKDINWVADKVVTFLRSSLNAKIASINSDVNDGAPADPITSDNFYISELEKFPDFPLCCVIGNDTTTGSRNGEMRYGIERHDFTIAIALVGNDGEGNLRRRTSKTIRAIHEVLDADPTLGGYVIETTIHRKRYGGLMAHEDNALLQEGQLSVEILTT